MSALQHARPATKSIAPGLRNLDLLRSLAVSLVLWDHLTLNFGRFRPGNGIFGVYLFFLHTALVLMWSLERQPFVLPFYIRRIFRIYPLATVATLVALLFHMPVAQGGGWYLYHTPSARQIFSSLLLVHDLAHSSPVVAVFWSLSIEVQMYIVLPALFFFADHDKQLWEVILLWALTVLLVLAYVPFSLGNVFPTVAPNFLAGVLAFVAYKRFRPVLPAWLFLPFLFVLLGIYLTRPETGRAWPLTFALALALPLFREITFRPLVVLTHHLALYSYGIYVWHLFGIKLAYHLLADRGGAIKTLFVLLFTLLTSVLGYHLIEAPMMRLGGRLQNLAHPRMRPPVPDLEPVP